jgi:stress-induced morphogen
VKVSHSKPKDEDKPEGKKPSTPAKAPKLTATQTVWVKKTNLLCRESKSQVQAVVGQGSTATRAGVLELFSQLKKVNAELNDRFLAIATPEGYQQDAARLRALFVKEERYFNSMQRALEQRDLNTFYALNDRLTEIALDETDILTEIVDRTGGGDHFHVTVVSPRFADLSLVDQHRLVYDALAEPLADGTIHELRITTRGDA